jgi:hypothetical protein
MKNGTLALNASASQATFLCRKKPRRKTIDSKSLYLRLCLAVLLYLPLHILSAEFTAKTNRKEIEKFPQI